MFYESRMIVLFYFDALAETWDLDMVAIICRTLDKLQMVNNTEFEAIEFVPVYE